MEYSHFTVWYCFPLHNKMDPVIYIQYPLAHLDFLPIQVTISH